MLVAHDLFVELLDGRNLLVLHDNEVEPTLEVNVRHTLWISLKRFADTQDGPHQVQGSVSFAFFLEVVNVFLINGLELLHYGLQFAHDDSWADMQELVQEAEAQQLHVLAAILDSDYGRIDN